MPGGEMGERPAPGVPQACGRHPQQLHCGRQMYSSFWQRDLRRSSALRPRPPSLRTVEARSSSDFFDRAAEQSLLLAQLKQKPESVLVIVGPRSSGKTRLLEEMLVGGKKHEMLVALVDGRSQKLTDAGIMAAVLREQGAGWEQTLKKMGPVAEAAAATSATMLKLDDGLKPLPPALAAAMKLFEEPTARSLNDVISAYDRLLRLTKTRIKETNPLPVICIDEANVLMAWYKGGAVMEADLDALLRFFVNVTKVTRRAHVILATSEYSFITWLNEKLGSDFRTQVIGDFPEAEARIYLEQNMGESITDAEWAKIFEVCGGNAGKLVTASAQYAVLEDWTEVLGEIWRKPMDTMVSGLDGGFPWTTAQYRTLLRLISESDHGAVIARDAYEKLNPGGKQAVQAMVKANLLSYRPQSGWARDMPVEAFGPDRLPVVMAPSSTHLYCMRRLLQRGSLSSAAQAASSPPSAALKSSPLEQQLKDVEQQLKDVEQQLKGVVEKIAEVDKDINDLRSAKTGNWQDEFNYLRDEKKQLRRKEEQLRRKEEQLRRKEEQLREERLLLLRKSHT